MDSRMWARLARRELRQKPVAGYIWHTVVDRCEKCSRDPRRLAPIGEMHEGRRVEQDLDMHGRVARERIFRTGQLCLEHVRALVLVKQGASHG